MKKVDSNNILSGEGRQIIAEKLRSAKRHVPGTRKGVLQVFFLMLQVGLVVVWFLISRRYITNFYLLCEFISLCVVLYIVRSDSNSSFKIPWIILNLAAPVLGGLSYLVFGHVRFNKDERRHIKAIEFKNAEIMFERKDAMEAFAMAHSELEKHAQYTRNNAVAPIYGGTETEYFRSGEELFPRLIEELEHARKFIFMEFFIIHSGYMWDTIEDVLARKAAEGVEVRLMYDSIGSMGLVPGDFVERLAKRGICACEFNRLTNILSARFNNRDHRKIVVIDGNVGFTGGVNLADEYINRIERFGYWKDTMIMLRGEGVRTLSTAFMSLWELMEKEPLDYREYMPTISLSAQGFVQPYADSPYDDENVGENVYRGMLCRANDYVYITTPYLIIDDEMINALTIAAKSGVDVRIITPGIPDKKTAYTLTRSYYEVLLRSGVRIFEYTPGFMHAKMFVADDNSAVVGTINLDYRSLCHHFECAVWMCDTPVIADIKADILECMDKSREVTLKMCQSKPLLWRVWQALLRILAPLF